ncbi:MAG: hypothetical protein IPM32_00155 [Ignavibacteriae bacterium]|nr:hypothetical protein [Ignavibacteriota bacterium]
MNIQKSIMNLFIFTALSFLLSGTILAQHQHGSDSIQTEKKKMNCCKTMNGSNHEMKSEKTEIGEKNNIDLGIIDKNKDGKVYQCPMCADQIADDPGECSKCGMDLKEVSIDNAQQVLDKNGHEMIHSKMMDNDIKDTDYEKIDMKKNNIVREDEIHLMAIDKNKDGKVFQCPMHFDQISDKSGECAECGMKLKEISTKEVHEKLKKYNHK